MQAYNKRVKKAKWNKVAKGLKGNKKSSYKYIQEKEQNTEKNIVKQKFLSMQTQEMTTSLSHLLYFSIVGKI